MAGEQIAPYLGNKIIRWLLDAADMPARPSALYMGLWDGNPLGAGTEVTTTVRVAGRVAVDFEAAPAAGVDNEVASEAETSFGNSAGNATVSYVTLHDAAAAGNMLWVKQLPAPLNITIGALVTVPAGDTIMSVGEV